MGNSYLFKACQVHKKVGKTILLRDINFEIGKGQNTAIIGHNGSGKSSLLKIIAGIYEPTDGFIKRTTKKIAYVPEHFPEKIRFKMKEYLLLIGEISGQPKQPLIDRIMNYADIFQIKEFLKTPLKNCSKGTKQKAGIIQALLSAPDLLLLDEPLSGLDSDSQFELLQQLTMLKRKSTIVFTAHEQELVNKLADSIVELKAGKLVCNQKKDMNLKKISIKVLVPNNDIIQKDDRLMDIQWENGSIVNVAVDASFIDQVLLNLLNSGASIIEVKEKG